MRHLRNTVILMILLCSISQGNAAVDAGYRKAQSMISQMHLSDKLKSSLSTVRDVLPKIEKSPPQTAYYSHPEDLKVEGQEAVEDSASLSVVQKATLERPRVIINLNTPGMKRNRLIQKNADKIADGTYKDCQKKTFMTEKDNIEHCLSPNAIRFSCDKTLKVTVKSRPPITPCLKLIRREGAPGHLPNGAHLLDRITWRATTIDGDPYMRSVSFYSFPSGSVSGDCLLPGSFFESHRTGVFKRPVELDPGEYKLHGQLINPDTAGYSKISIEDLTNRSLGAFEAGPADNIAELTVDSPGTFNMRFYNTGTVSEKRPLLAISYLTEPAVAKPIITKSFDHSCGNRQHLIGNANCHLQRKYCAEPNVTKNIAGQTITAPCWREESQYVCGGSEVDTCGALINRGCQQLSASCSRSDDGLCLSSNETFSCPISVPTGSGLECGSKLYCTDGSCEETPKEQSSDFGKSATDLGVMAAAADDVKSQGETSTIDPQNIRIFKGEVAKCRQVSFGAINCCQNSGWAKGIIAHCNAEEKMLGRAKEKGGLVIEVGSYCAHRTIFGACTEHKKSYCVFPSRIAYDVQRYGRKEQLNRKFGSGKHPDCSGLSPEEMESIDFDKINFANAVDDVTGSVSLPNADTSSEAIKKAIKRLSDRNTPYAQ